MNYDSLVITLLILGITSLFFTITTTNRFNNVKLTLISLGIFVICLVSSIIIYC